MSANKHLTALAISTALVIGQSALAQEPAGDSAYQWGRWAVLSPASGGEPFSGPDEPGADFNVRPGDFFGPEVASLGSPSVPPGVGDINPEAPVVTQPPTLPVFPAPPGVGNINPSVPVVTAPPTLPVFGGPN